MRTTAQIPTIHPRRLNYEFTGFIHASEVSLIQRDPEFRSRGSTEKPCKYRDFPRRTPRDFAPYGNRLENRENAYSRSMNLLVNTHLFCPNFLFILPGASGRNSGSHEVSGSIPLISTKKKDTTYVVSFFLLPFDHLTAGMNPAYDNSPLTLRIDAPHGAPAQRVGLVETKWRENPAVRPVGSCHRRMAAARKRRSFWRSQKKMQPARRRRSRRSIPLIRPHPSQRALAAA